MKILPSSSSVNEETPVKLKNLHVAKYIHVHVTCIGVMVVYKYDKSALLIN